MDASDSLFTLCRDDPDGVVELVERLNDAELKAQVAFRDESGATPLFIASENGYRQVVKLLLAAGVDKDAATNKGRTPLYTASGQGHHQVVELLLAAGADKNAAEKDGWTPLHSASANGHLQVVEMLLAAGVDRDAAMNDTWTPLSNASFFGSHLVVEMLLAAGADKNAAEKDGKTPLYIASWQGHHQVVEVLLAAGVDKDTAMNDGRTPLHIASEYGNHQVVELLLAAGADMNAAEKDGWTPLHSASANGHLQVVEMLLAAGADKDATDKDGKTPLYRASFFGHHQVAEFLLAAGANKNAASNDGWTPLNCASFFGHQQVVEILLAAGAEKETAANGRTPLWMASRQRHHRVVEVLLAAGADKDAVDNDGCTPLIFASSNGYHQVVEMLLAAGADKEAATKKGNRGLHLAIRSGYHEVVMALLAAGANKDAVDGSGHSSMFLAIQNGHHQMVEMLLTAGVETEAINHEGKTPMQIASQFGHHQVVEVLLAAGANKNAAEKEGWTPLHIASRNGHHHVVEVLLAGSVDKEATNKYGATPLYVASENGHLEVVEVLLAAGVDKNAAHKDGWTPLHVASQKGYHQVVEMLLVAGADKEAANKYGGTPLFVASQNGHHQAVEVLLAAGVDKNAAHKDGRTPLHVASRNGKHPVVEVLLAAGANKDIADNEGRTPLYMASEENCPQVVEMLIAAGADKNAATNAEWVPLHVAIRDRYQQVVDALKVTGAEKSDTTNYGRTPLFVACEKGHDEIVRHLLSVGADKSRRSLGLTPLEVAHKSGFEEIPALLVSSNRPPPSALIAASMTSLNRVKLMVVGRAAVGKTTLVRALFGKQLDTSIPSTDGIDLGQFSAGGIDFMTWDFGGQKVYRYTHQLFLSSHAVYLVLYKASDPEAENLREVRFWLSSISARISDSVVLLVGTHADKVVAKVAESRGAVLLQTIRQEYPLLFQVNHHVHVISAYATAQPSFKGLLAAIIQAGQSVNFPAPRNYANALSYLMELQLSPPVIELRTSIESLQTRLTVGNSEAQILRLLNSFHTLGFISVFQNDELPSRGVIVLRPQWIAKLLATIVTTRHNFVSKDSGVLSHLALVNHLWTDHAEFPPERHPDLIELLVQLGIFFPVDQHEGGKGYFVPCMLREETPDVGFYLPSHLTEAVLQLHRVVKLECVVPISVIPPIVVELMGCGELRARWQQGCVVRIPATQPTLQDQVWLQLWRSGGRTIELKMWGESIHTVTQWLRRLCSRIDSRLKEFYHVGYRTLIPCCECLSTDTSSDGHFDLLQLRDHVLQSHTEATCRPDGVHHCRLDMMVPDLLFLDLTSRGFVVPSESLTEICELGQGAFGKVLKMSMAVPLSVEDRDHNQTTGTSKFPTCSSRSMPEDQRAFSTSSPTSTLETIVVAVKFLEMVKGKESESGGHFFEEFKHEVYLMSSLDDPNVVKLSGICLHPKLAMVMELVEGGDLYGQLNDPFRLRSRVFGLVKCLNAEFLDFNTEAARVLSFKHVFLNRDKLADDDREPIETKIALLLEKSRANAIGWIQEQFDQKSRSVEFTQLTNINPITDLGMTAEQLELLGMPKRPQLLTLGKGTALGKARRAFEEWKENASGSNGLVQDIESWERRFFEGVEQLFAMQVAHTSSRDIRRMTEEVMKEIEDGVEQLAKQQAAVVAPVDEALRLKLAIDIARGMVHLHELNPPIVHRDLKTPNIFLNRSLLNFPPLDDNDNVWRTPLAKVGDFGLSLLSFQSHSFQIRDRAEDDPLLNLNPTWAAPELLSGRRYSTPVDVYAMGIILWELLTRQHPFEDILMHQLASQVISGHRPAVPAVMAEDPNLKEYLNLTTSCWHQNPSQRPSIREVYSSLRDICQARCSKLAEKLLPPPAARAAVIQRENSNHENMTVPIVTSHLFVLPAGSQNSQAAVPRVSCMVAPLKQQELLWLGLESGHVATVEYRHGDPQREMLRWIECCDWDKHKQRVTAISYLCRNPEEEEEGTVWTGSEDGSIHVWCPQLRSLDEIHDANTLKGRLEHLSRFLFIERFAPCWAECENGIMSWSENRHDLKPIKSLPVSSLRSIYMPDSRSLSIVDSLGKTHNFRQPLDCEEGGRGAAEWHRVLNNILSAHESRARGITRLAMQRQSQQAILELEGIDHTMWSANAALLLTEWGLDNTVDHHGLHRTMLLRPLRNVRLDGTKLEPARLRVIGGFVRVAASVLWVAVGDRWVVLDVTPGAANTEAKWQEAMVEGMDKIAAVLSVRTEQGQEVWTIDYEGRRVVWRYADPENPELAGELVDEGWREEDGRGYCMAQVGGKQVWVGTSQGRILSWDAPSRHLVRPELQPLSASHSLAHGRSVHALVSIPGAQPPIVWSASRDQTLRRFSW